MSTGTWARSYDEMVDVLTETLEALERKLETLSESDWARPTLLRPPMEDKPSWTVLQLAAHMDFFMGMVNGLVGEAHSGPPILDRASFCMAASDRHEVAPAVYQIMIDHAEGHTPATVLDAVRGTFKQALEAIRNTPRETVGPAFFGPIRLDEFVPTRVVETAVHGIDLTDAIGQRPLDLPRTYQVAAEVLDEVIGRRWIRGRPADLADDDLAFVRAASGRGPHSDPRLPVVG
ncbi:MAG TPA: maleylpyruvate isomerase family mycothiol-dependent enzyme [Acidimicrobiales bacterium]|nr:maleylpyruvate isomerase family mycothiol-dependent enzyme [Acidimicrobiales bacterium]